MKKNQIRQLCVHILPSPDGGTVADRLNRFHAQAVARQLDRSGFPAHVQAQLLSEIRKWLSESPE